MTTMTSDVDTKGNLAPDLYIVTHERAVLLCGLVIIDSDVSRDILTYNRVCVPHAALMHERCHVRDPAFCTFNMFIEFYVKLSSGTSLEYFR